jgi:hypothetical protein
MKPTANRMLAATQYRAFIFYQNPSSRRKRALHFAQLSGSHPSETSDDRDLARPGANGIWNDYSMLDFFWNVCYMPHERRQRRLSADPNSNRPKSVRSSEARLWRNEE